MTMLASPSPHLPAVRFFFRSPLFARLFLFDLTFRVP